MKHVDEFRDRAEAERYVEALHREVDRPWTLMEVCGGQTHAILRFGIDGLLPPGLELLHGPGCPVCVTPAETIDRALAIAARPEVTLCSFGDMLRVPGTRGDLAELRSRGADVRSVLSPLDAVELARQNPDRQVVFLAVGFETTAPANAMAAWYARELGLENFSLLCSHVLVPPALEAIAAERRVDGFLAAGHVCAITGLAPYRGLVERHRVPTVVTGFEPVDLLLGILTCVRQLARGEARLENAYRRTVRDEGNPHAIARVAEVFEVVDQHWRGIGRLPESGLALRPAFQAFDAMRRFDVGALPAARELSDRCQSGKVLLGLLQPDRCPEFGRSCTPERPLGATMVSSEGACAAYYRYRREAAS